MNESSGRNKVFQSAAETFINWDGNHLIDAVGPTIYHRLFYHLSIYTFADEIGEKGTMVLLSTSLADKSIPRILSSPESPWWDNMNTKEKIETRQDILSTAWVKTGQRLQLGYGPSVENWEWGRIHTLEIQHLLGRKKPLNLLFNLGPYPVPGSKGVLNQLRHKYGPKALKVSSGPSTRRVIDFSDAEYSDGISPTGQSGYFFFFFYPNQTPLYLAGKFRTQRMNREDIIANQISRLIVLPE
jgi:penicillin amidase